VEHRHLDNLQRMYCREEQLERRLVLMTILKQSPPETLRGAVAGQKVVAELQKWLQSAVETKEYRLAFRVIETLDKLPIDRETFQVGWPRVRMQKIRPRCAAAQLRAARKRALLGRVQTPCKAGRESLSFGVCVPILGSRAG